MKNSLNMTITVKCQGEQNMNTFHELNIMTSRGDIRGAFSLIRKWNENVARKIMKKAGYTVTQHAGRAFWTWVQETLSRAAGQRRSGYQARAERQAPVRRWRQQAAEDYDSYAQMMASGVPAQAEAAAEGKVTPIDAVSEKCVAIRGSAERLIHLCRHREPAPARVVPVLKLQHAGGRIVARAAKQLRCHFMPVHSVLPVRAVAHVTAVKKSGVPPGSNAILGMKKGDLLLGLRRCYRPHAAKPEPT